MDKEERVALAIKEVVSKMMDRVMDNVLVNDPFIKEVNLLGKDYRGRIYREFLKIEPPHNFEEQ